MGLSMGRKTGYGSFGPKFKMRGARIFELSFDLNSGSMKVDTWIRQEDGSVDK